MPRQTAVVVCGVHRSGTSALTRVLSLLGSALPKNLYPAGLGNETGHWEPVEVVRINNEMLDAVGTHWAAIWEPEGNWLSSAPAQRLTQQIKDVVAAEYGDQPLFVIKDPRLSLVLPLWNAAFDELGIRRCTVVCFRNPLEVALSLQLRNQTPYDVWHLDRGAFLWLRYVLAAERHSRGEPRGLCDYADFLSDWRGTVQRLGAKLDISWPRRSVVAENEIDEFLQPGLRHHTSTSSIASLGGVWADWVDPVYRELQKGAGVGELNFALLDKIEASYRSPVRAVGRYLVAVHDALFARQGEVSETLSKCADYQQRLKHAARETERLKLELTARDMAVASRDAAATNLELRLNSQARAIAERDHELDSTRQESALNHRLYLEAARSLKFVHEELGLQSQQLQERDRELALQSQQLQERDRELALQSQQLQERDRELALQSQQLQERDRELALQSQQLQERDRELALQSQQLQERDRELALQSQQLQERDRELALQSQQLNAVTHSRSWRLTYPLRGASASLRRLARLTRGMLRPVHQEIE